MEIEKAKEISSSENWRLICLELDNWIQMELSRLKSCPPEELINIQTRVRVLEGVKGLPQTVIEREE